MTQAEQLAALEAVAQRAAEDFTQRQNNMGDYAADSSEWQVYVHAYGMRLAQARANGEAV